MGTIIRNAYPNSVVDVELSAEGVLAFFNDAAADSGGAARMLHFPVGTGAAAALPPLPLRQQARAAATAVRIGRVIAPVGHAYLL